jgi:hypothetical protein
MANIVWPHSQAAYRAKRGFVVAQHRGHRPPIRLSVYRKPHLGKYLMQRSKNTCAKSDTIKFSHAAAQHKFLKPAVVTQLASVWPPNLENHNVPDR